MHEEHLCVVALTSNGAGNPVLSACLFTSLCDRLLLFVYFPVNNGVVYLDYEGFSSSWSSAVLVSMIVLDLSLLFDDILVCLPFCWCPCMAINVSVQYDGGFLPDIILLTQCYYHRGTRLNAMKRFCIFSY